MDSRDIQKELSQKVFIEPSNKIGFCEASKASAEIMLERFCNGKEIDFPFSQ